MTVLDALKQLRERSGASFADCRLARGRGEGARP